MRNKNRQPNILMLVGEDTGRHLGCYADPDAVTPNLDGLAAEGVRFDEAYATAPVCAPSRSTLITGQYPQKIGTHHMRSKLLSPPRLFTQDLRDVGYHVNWWGKLDFNFDPDAAFGEDGWRDDQTDWKSRLAAGDLPDQPWLLYTNLPITHESGIWPDDEHDGRPSNGARYSFGKGAFVDVPRVHDPDTVHVPAYFPDTAAVRQDIAQHADNVTYLDTQIGEILEALDRSGQRDNMIVIFLADHGRGLPREKRWCYTAGLHMPLIVRWPNGLKAGTADDRLVSWVDLAPTILSLAGAPIPADYDGVAFLGEAADEPRSVVFAGRDRIDEAFDRQRAARDHQYHYIRNFYPRLPYAQRATYHEFLRTMRELRRLHAAGELTGDAGVFMQETKPPEELYDTRADPDCVRNLADDPHHAAARARLAAEVDAWIERTGDLGAIPERDLIERGWVADQLEGYRSQIQPLPPEHRLGPERTLIEMHEADCWQQTSDV